MKKHDFWELLKTELSVLQINSSYMTDCELSNRSVNVYFASLASKGAMKVWNKDIPTHTRNCLACIPTLIYV